MDEQTNERTENFVEYKNERGRIAWLSTSLVSNVHVPRDLEVSQYVSRSVVPSIHHTLSSRQFVLPLPPYYTFIAPILS